MNEPIQNTPPANQPPYAVQEVSEEAVRAASTWVVPLKQELSRVIVGQSELIHRLLVAILADGHVLLEGVPGLAKTLTLSTLADAIQTGFQRIQFTPDMLPADIIGTEIFRPDQAEFVVKQGPVFSNIVLADEINRAPAKVQAALLEAMQERQVTIGEQTFKLPDLFLVMATQNPIEQEGTYPLPEAQIDRFMLKVVVNHPTIEEERAILDVAASLAPKTKVSAVIREQDILSARQIVNLIHIDDRIKDYIVNLVYSTRDPGRYSLDLSSHIENGASPRATINLTLASKAAAFLAGRNYVTPQDVKDMAMDVLRHRIAVTYEADAENITSENIVQTILDTIPVP